MDTSYWGFVLQGILSQLNGTVNTRCSGTNSGCRHLPQRVQPAWSRMSATSPRILGQPLTQVLQRHSTQHTALSTQHTAHSLLIEDSLDILE
jgi:hypothetical protein